MPKILTNPIVNSLLDGGMAVGNIRRYNSTKYFLIFKAFNVLSVFSTFLNSFQYSLSNYTF